MRCDAMLPVGETSIRETFSNPREVTAIYGVVREIFGQYVREADLDLAQVEPAPRYQDYLPHALGV